MNSVDLIVQSYQHAFRTVLGREWDEAEIKTWIGQSLRDAIYRASPEHGAELFATYTEWNEAHTDQLIRPFAGVRELVADLVAAGVRVGAATSKRQQPAVRTLDLGGLTGLKERVIAASIARTFKFIISAISCAFMGGLS